VKKRLLAAGLVAVALSVNLVSCAHSSGYLSGDRTPQSAIVDGWTERFGACLVSPDNHDFENAWTLYHQLIQKKVRVNLGHYDQMQVTDDVREFITSLSTIAPLIYSWDAIKTSAWMTHMYKDKNFVSFTLSAAFVYALKDTDFVEKNQDPNFIESYKDPEFQKNFNEIVSVIRDPNGLKALTYFHKKKLVFVDPVGLKSALNLITFFGLPNSLDQFNGISLMKDLPQPDANHGEKDVFASAYWDVFESSVSHFLETNLTGESDLDHAVDPDQGIPFDDYVVKAHANDPRVQLTKTIYGKEYQVTVPEITAIDGVARTLWGEASECEVGRNVHGFSAVGLVMANRAIAIQNTINGRSGYKAVMKKNVEIIENADGNDSLEGFVPEQTLGQSIFGRPGSSLLPAAQVVSRREQFSCWNGYYPKQVKLSSIAPLPKGMPDFNYTIKIPANSSDEHDLVNVLCPTINANVHKHDGRMGWNTSFPNSYDVGWKEAVDLATLIVLDPQKVKQLYNFVPAPTTAPLFYTNGNLNQPGQPEIHVEGMTFKDPDTGTTESFTGGARCNAFRVFGGRTRTLFGVSP
jgi:hypothetical protein